MIEYEGYTGFFAYDPSVDAFHGRVIGLRDVVTFEGRSVDELRREMAASVDDYVTYCAEIGKEPERPYRGEFLIRTTSELHRAFSIEAESAGMSLNAWVEATLAEAVKGSGPSGTRSAEPAPRPVRRKVTVTDRT